jgi:drug/metabolite transporter (DMT)-like permease
VRAPDTARTEHTDLPFLAGTAAVVAWGAGPLIVRGISASTSTIVAYRLGLAIPVMWAAAYLAGGRASAHLFRLAAVPGVLFALSMMTSFASFQRTSIANATLIPALQPVLVLLVAAHLFGERVSARQLGFAAVAVAGVATVVLGAGAGSGASWSGDVLAVANLVLFTVYFLIVKRARDAGVHSWAFVAAVMSVATMVALPWALLVADDLGAIGGTDWVLLVAMILGPGLMGHGLMTWSQRHLDITVASLLTLATPVVSAVGAWLIYDQALRLVQVLGAAAVLVALAGIVLAARSRVLDEATEAGLSGPGETLLT